MATKSIEPKRKPGRPPKKKENKYNEIFGISNTPMISRNIVEFYFNDPAKLSKLWKYFEKMKSTKIHIILKKKYVIIGLSDHTKNINNLVKIDCTKIRHYYCKEEIEIGLDATNINRIVSTINKDSILFTIIVRSVSTRKSINVTIKNNMDFETVHTIDVTGDYSKSLSESKFNGDDHAINFLLPGAYFKQFVNSVTKISSNVSITQNDNKSPLVFEYISLNKKSKAKTIMNDLKKIDLVSKLGNDESFRMQFILVYLSAISKANLSDFVRIFVDEKKQLLIKLNLTDSPIYISILVNIIRPDI